MVRKPRENASDDRLTVATEGPRGLSTARLATGCLGGKATGCLSGNWPLLLTQTLGLADQFLFVRCATTFRADMPRVADKLGISLEIRLQQLLQFTERSGH